MANKTRATSWSLSDSGLPLPIMLVAIMPIAWYGSFLATDESKAIESAQELGYTDIKVVDKKPIGFLPDSCEEGDTAEFTVTGAHPKGEKQTVTICTRIFR